MCCLPYSLHVFLLSSVPLITYLIDCFVAKAHSSRRFWLEWGCSHVTGLVRRTRLHCPHAMGTHAFSRMIPRLPLRLRSGLRQNRDFGSRLRRQPGASTSCCYRRPVRLLRCPPSVRAGSGCLPRTQADEFWSRGEGPTRCRLKIGGQNPHPKIAKSAILGWAPAPHSTPSLGSVAQGRLRLFTTDASRRILESG